MGKTYRKIRRHLTEKEAVNMLANAYTQRANCIEHLMTIRLGKVPALIQTLCNQSTDDMIDECNAQIAWLDQRIADLRRFIKSDIRITDLM